MTKNVVQERESRRDVLRGAGLLAGAALAAGAAGGVSAEAIAQAPNAAAGPDGASTVTTKDGVGSTTRTGARVSPSSSTTAGLCRRTTGTRRCCSS